MVAFITRFLMVNNDFLSSPFSPDGFTFDFSLYSVYLDRRTVFQSSSWVATGLSYDENFVSLAWKC